MNIILRLFSHREQNQLSYRLLLYVVLCSSFFTLLATAFQLYMDYKRDLTIIHTNIKFIEESYVPAIAASLYYLDEKQLEIQLQGALKLLDIRYLQVREPRGKGELKMFKGNPDVSKGFVREFPLEYFISSDNKINIGTLTAIASLEGVYQRLWEKILVVLGTNAIKMFLAAFCILLIIQFTVTRHLSTMAKYTQQLNLNKLDRELVLNRSVSETPKPDELEHVVKAINDMQERMRLDIVNRKKVEEALRGSEEKFRSIFHSEKDAILVFDAETLKFFEVNDAALDLYGYTQEEFLKLIPTDISAEPEASNKAVKKLANHLPIGNVADFERKHKRSDGTIFLAEIISSAFILDGRKMICNIMRDITERKRAENQIQFALKEKEVLLREIHHRVKNNMQVISSLLRLQSANIREKQYVDMLKDSQSRIKSMALVHEKLYQSENFAEVDFNEYTKALVNSLFRSYGADPVKIALRVEVDDVSLELDRAIPCGLIINELVSNALKYAFPEDREGEIRVTLGSTKEDEFKLTVSDNGAGMPEQIDFRNTETLGLHLVTILAEDQLYGNIELNRIGGTNYYIKFKQSREKARV